MVPGLGTLRTFLCKSLWTYVAIFVEQMLRSGIAWSRGRVMVNTLRLWKTAKQVSKVFHGILPF